MQQIRLAFFAALWGLICSCGKADENISLTWMPSPSPDVRGYAVYYGPASASYDYRFDAGTNTTSIVSNLTSGLTYYFVVVTVDSNSDESVPSNEASYSVPDPPLAFSSIESTNGQVVLTWATVPGKAYQIEFTTDLTQPEWHPLGGVVTAWSPVTTIADASCDPQRFYRIKVVPVDAPALGVSRE